MINNLKIRNVFSSLIYEIIFSKNKNYTKDLVALDYHFFTDSEISLPGLEVSYSVLDKQLKLLSEFFKPLETDAGLRSFFKKQVNKDKPGVLISIDDADKSIKFALKYFIKYQIPVVLFIPLGLCIDKNIKDGKRSRILCRYHELFPHHKELTFHDKSKFFDLIINSSIEELSEYELRLGPPSKKINVTASRKLLSFKEIEVIARNPLVTIASHSMSHNSLAELPDNWLKWEIQQSRKYIKALNGNHKLFAYPFGHKKSYNKKVKKLLQDEGIQYAFSTSSKKIRGNSDLLSLGRAPMLNFDGKPYVCGSAYGAFHYWDKILQR
ncbi:polysaccharide deacetylase family protein [Prochlorococcus sp. AH-716-D22]|nr:polysaccharide deacetylase family protein [Prochlorococcus sp. AH-716-D22]